MEKQFSCCCRNVCSTLDFSFTCFVSLPAQRKMTYASRVMAHVCGLFKAAEPFANFCPNFTYVFMCSIGVIWVSYWQDVNPYICLESIRVSKIVHSTSKIHTNYRTTMWKTPKILLSVSLCLKNFAGVLVQDCNPFHPADV